MHHNGHIRADILPGRVFVILHPWTRDLRPGHPFNFIAYENNPILDKDMSGYPAVALMLYGSNVMRIVLNGCFVRRFVPLERVRYECGHGADEWRRRIADTYVDNVFKAERVSRAFGAGFIAFYQPMVYRGQ